jgi:hypothetical protein
METMNKTMCAGMEAKLAELVLDPASAPAKVKTHVEACEGCRAELDALRGTMAAMDAWTAPEPNPYFMTRFEARLREEKAAAPAGWFARLKANWLYGPRMQARPLAAMALTVCVLIGGGAYLNSYWDQPAVPVHPATASAVVHDLQTLDSNAQLLDQMEAIDNNQPDNSQTQE